MRHFPRPFPTPHNFFMQFIRKRKKKNKKKKEKDRTVYRLRMQIQLSTNQSKNTFHIIIAFKAHCSNSK